MILLDTHAMLWLASDPDRLSAKAAAVIEHDGEIAISAISAQEIAYLAARGRIGLGRPARGWIGQAQRQHAITALPVTVGVAARAGELDPEGFTGDPIDRIIYATALERGMRLVTADRRIRAFDPTRCVW